MPRKKVKLAWIICDSARKATLRKRKNGIMKKVSNLSVLCDVDALIIIYNPNNNVPNFWPSRPEIQQKLARFQNMPDFERSKKTTNQEIYLKERTLKLQDQLKRSQIRNNEATASLLMHQLYQGKALDGFSSNELLFMLSYIQEKMKIIKTMIEHLKPVKAHVGSIEHHNLIDGPSTEIEHNSTDENQKENFTEKNVGKSFGNSDYENGTMRSSYKNFIVLDKGRNDMTMLKQYEDINTGFEDISNNISLEKERNVIVDTRLRLAIGNAHGSDSDTNTKKK